MSWCRAHSWHHIAKVYIYTIDAILGQMSDQIYLSQQIFTCPVLAILLGQVDEKIGVEIFNILSIIFSKHSVIFIYQYNRDNRFHVNIMDKL